MSLLQEISISTGLGASDVLRIIGTAPARYKVFPIEKRGGGIRLIAQPSRELKVLQRLVLEERLNRLQVHKAATAYVIGRNISDNAQAHKNNAVILKLDFENFFPSIRVRDWKTYMEKRAPDLLLDASLLTNILFWGQIKNSITPKCLSIGAPTSPKISNLVMYEFDEIVSRAAEELEIAYTRYADDITISGPNIDSVIKLERFIRNTVKELKSPQLKINEAKRGLYTKGQRRMVTGLILTPEGKVSIGRQRKRKISTLLHKFSLGQLAISDVGFLKGMLGFSIANEPIFVSRMREKYGSEILNKVLATEIPTKDLPHPKR